VIDMSSSNIQLKMKQGVPSPFQRQLRYVRNIMYHPVLLGICVARCVTPCHTSLYEV